MPTGKVKWYDASKGFGFLSVEDAEDVFVRSDALPEGCEELFPGQKIEFDMVAGRRGPQALRVTHVEARGNSSRKSSRGSVTRKHSADELHGMIEDLIKLLEATVQPGLARGKFPERQPASRIAEAMRAVARELEA